MEVHMRLMSRFCYEVERLQWALLFRIFRALEVSELH
jgi:hypothetical protein